MPISWANAERLLEELGGLEAGRLLSGKSSEALVKLTNHGMHAKIFTMSDEERADLFTLFLQLTRSRRRFGIPMLPFLAISLTKSSWWAITEMVCFISERTTFHVVDIFI